MSSDQTFWNDVSEGHKIDLQESMSTQRLVIWAAASGDFYQIHYDEAFAKANNLPGVIVHGALKGMLVGRLLDEWTGDAGRIVNWNVSYRGMDPVGQELLAWGRVTRKYEEEGEGRLDLDIGVTQPDGKETTPGSATVVLPQR